MKKHVTEIRYPEQCKEFQQITNELYRLMLEKNREYGIRNVQALGLLGLSLRLLEKVIRVLTIQGWDIWTGKLSKSVDNPKFGSIEDELRDISNVAILAILVGKEKWGK